jgi:hypothetical protein
MAKTKWKQLAGRLLAILGGIVLLFGVAQIDMTYTPGPGPDSRNAELWDMLYIQAGIVISFFGLNCSGELNRSRN